jgi:hypothetical protein
MKRVGAALVTKHSKAYWFARIYRSVSGGKEATNYCAQMSSGGVRRSLSLRTPKREDAAIRGHWLSVGRDIYQLTNAN